MFLHFDCNSKCLMEKSGLNMARVWSIKKHKLAIDTNLWINSRSIWILNFEYLNVVPKIHSVLLNFQFANKINWSSCHCQPRSNLKLPPMNYLMTTIWWWFMVNSKKKQKNIFFFFVFLVVIQTSRIVQNMYNIFKWI